MKVLDKTSPLLFDDCVTGNYLKKVDIIYDKPMGNTSRITSRSTWRMR